MRGHLSPKRGFPSGSAFPLLAPTRGQGQSGPGGHPSPRGRRSSPPGQAVVHTGCPRPWPAPAGSAAPVRAFLAQRPGARTAPPASVLGLRPCPGRSRLCTGRKGTSRPEAASGRARKTSRSRFPPTGDLGRELAGTQALHGRLFPLLSRDGVMSLPRETGDIQKVLRGHFAPTGVGKDGQARTEQL